MTNYRYEPGKEHLHLIDEVSDEEIKQHREVITQLGPDFEEYISRQTDSDIRNVLARITWLAALLNVNKDTKKG